LLDKSGVRYKIKEKRREDTSGRFGREEECTPAVDVG